MNTPAHIALNLLALARSPRSSPSESLQPTASANRVNPIPPVLIGAIIPDALMFVFYAIEKLIRGTPEILIWSERYYDPIWQYWFDITNSLPLMAVGLAVALWTRSQWWGLLFGSMILHVLGDLPLHHDDAHRHFLPLSDWRFISPVSYWDTDHYGGIVSVLEAIAVLVSCVILWQRSTSPMTKGIMLMLGSSYGLFILYVIWVWA